MPRESSRRIALDGLALPDVRTGELVTLAALPGAVVLTALRHRY